MAEPTREQLIAALRRADAAGDTDAARAIARRLSMMGPRRQGDGSMLLQNRPQEPAQQARQRLARAATPQGIPQAPVWMQQDMARQEAQRRENARQSAEAERANKEKMLADMPLPLRMAIGAGRPIGDLIDGLGQLGTQASDAIFGTNSAEAVNEDIQSRREADVTRQDTAANVGAFATDVGLTFAPFAQAARLPTAAQRIGAASGIGAAYAGAQPVMEGESRLVNAGIGGVAGGTGQVAGDLITAWGTRAAQSFDPARRRLVQSAQNLGIPLTPAQVTDNEFVRRLARMSSILPLSGAEKTAARQQQAGNQAIARMLGQQGDAVDSSMMGRAAEEIGDEFDNVMAAGMGVDDQLISELDQIAQQADSVLDSEAGRVARNMIDRIRTQAQNGTLDGRTVQSVDRALRQAGSSGNQDIAMTAQAMRDAVHDGFERTAAPEVRQAWDSARKKWAIMKTVEPVVARNPEGGIPLAQLQGAINTTKRGRTARARGRDGELGQVATVGQALKPPQSSGTAENLMTNPFVIGGVGTAGALTNPVLTGVGLGGGYLANFLLNTAENPVARGLVKFIARENPGATRQMLAKPSVPLIGQANAAGLAAYVEPGAKRKKRNDNAR